MRYLAFCTFMLFFVCCSCAIPEEEDSTELSSTEKTTLSQQFLEHAGLERRYLLYVPQSYQDSETWPVVFNFHGFGGNAEDHLEIADMREAAEEKKFILVYPQGALMDGSSHWNAGLKTDANKSSVDDFGFFSAMLSEIEKNYNIDQKRVFACGYSNGAFFSYALACYHSDKVAAIASVSGTMLEETYNECKAKNVSPILTLHGTNDYVVPYKGSEGLKSVEDVLRFWTKAHELTTEASVSKELEGVEKYSFSDSKGQEQVLHYKILEGEHVWFDLNVSGKKHSSFDRRFFLL